MFLALPRAIDTRLKCYNAPPHRPQSQTPPPKIQNSYSLCQRAARDTSLIFKLQFPLRHICLGMQFTILSYVIFLTSTNSQYTLFRIPTLLPIQFFFHINAITSHYSRLLPSYLCYFPLEQDDYVDGCSTTDHKWR
jgi:hypothetical protein